MKVILSKSLATVVVVLVCLLSLPLIDVKAQPRTIVVPDDYTSIQEAINNADEGDTVFVKSGIYYQTAIINKSLSLVGENREITIIDGNGNKTRIYIERDNVTITGFTIRNALVTTEAGILLMRVDYCNISENKLTDNSRGIDLLDSSYNIIAGNFMEENGAGVYFRGFNNSIYGNEIVNCNTGIQIFYGANNTISENNLVNNSANGINFYNTNNNYIIGNNMTNPTILEPLSGEQGIMFTASHNNIFYHNNFKNIQVVDNGWLVPPWIPNSSINVWDNGIEGNYWSAYNGTDADGDGIGDTPYVYGGNAESKYIDEHPLMEPVPVIPEFPSWIILLLFLVTSLIIVLARKKIGG